MNSRKHTALALAAFAILAATARGEEPKKGPLSSLPSKPGAHLDKIKALGDNEWLSLGEPTADPRWGKARGRSWCTNMPYAADVGGMFVFGEGEHAYIKPDGHYMNDLWCYDVNANRWVCLYPGIEVKSLVQRIKDKELFVNDNGFMVDKNDQPLPPLLIHAYGYLGYDPEHKKFLMLARQFDNYFATGDPTRFREANQLYTEQLKGKKKPQYSPFFYDVTSGNFESLPVEKGVGGRPYGGQMLVYVQSKKQFWYGGTEGAWYFDRAKSTWTPVKTKGDAPTGIDHCVAYDTKRDRIYNHCDDASKAEDNFVVYDVKSDTWSRPAPSGAAPTGLSGYESIYNYDTVNDKLVVIRLYPKKDDPGRKQGIYVYDPATNTWADPLPIPSEVIKAIRNGNYGCYVPELNAYFCHFASDSRDNGTMWVYRYKAAKK